MYKLNRNRQFSLSDFNQPIGLKMNSENRWIKKAETIPWNEIEEQYAALFPSETGISLRGYVKSLKIYYDKARVLELNSRKSDF